MANQTLLRISTGAIVGLGAAATPLGDIPSIVVLKLLGVSDPSGCLKWIINPEISRYYHPCSPIVDPISLGFITNIIVFIAILLIILAGWDLAGKALSK
jgi:hypothetical protein